MPGRRTALTIVSAATLLLSVFAHPALAATTVGLWHMDETSGSVAVDSSGYGNDGTLQSVTFASGAYSFNGTSSKVLVPDDPSLRPDADDITISVQVNFPSIHIHDYDLVRKGMSGEFYKIEIASNGKARCQFHGSNNDAGMVLGPDLADGAWHTITCTKTGSKILGDVDGNTASRSVTVGSITNTAPLSMGGKSSGTQDLYRGLMREVSITIG